MINPDPLLTHPLQVAANKFTDQLALISSTESISYSNLYHRASTTSKLLSQHGLKAGDIVVLDDLSSLEIIILWACSLGGFIAFPINTRFPIEAMAQLLATINPTLVLTYRDLLPGISSTPEKFLRESTTPDSDTISRPHLNQAMTLLMTSGSAGSAKLVQHSLINHMSSATGSNENIILESADRWLLNLPLYHVGGLAILFRSVLAGAALVIPNPDHTLLHNIEKYNITHLSLVATQLQRLLSEPEASTIWGQLKALLLGGSAIPQSLLKEALDLELPIHVSYGSTEMASQITTSSADNRRDSLSNSGQVLAGCELIISHEGEILVKGESLAQGYRNGSILLELRDSDGWFHTGDVGYMNVQGALTVTGRLDNQFISGGENIQPEHIERALQKLPGIIQAFIVPQSDAEFGFRPVAFLQLENPRPSVDQIKKDLKHTLPGYMMPIAYFQLPVDTEKLKISRQELQNSLIDINKPLHSLP